jgi:hypothetical protein
MKDGKAEPEDCFMRIEIDDKMADSMFIGKRPEIGDSMQLICIHKIDSPVPVWFFRLKVKQ